MKKRIFGLLTISLIACLMACGPGDGFQAAMEEYLKTDEGQEAVATAVESYFKKKQEEARKKQEQSEQDALEEQFKNPVKIDAGNSPVKGPKDAKITIIEFSDFQCPFCKRGKDTMEEVMKAYPNDVKLVFKQMPLDFHKMAKPAALAALAAAKQGKFWEMHDKFFDNQGELSSKGEEYIVQVAKEIGLNIDKFNADRKSKEIEDEVAADVALAGKNGINGTPGFFVNGVAVRGAYPYDHFKGIIDRWLEQK